MALISLLTRLVNGVQRQVDLSANTLVVQELKLNGILLTTTAGSGAIGDAGGYTNFTPTGATVRGALQGIDTALATSGSIQLDGSFRIENTSDTTKRIAFDASGIATATTRTITMPDANVNLGLVATAIQRSGSVAFTANQPMGGFILTGLGAGTTAGNSVRYEQVILVTGANAFTANQSMGANRLTNLADPTAAQDAVTKAYADSLSAGLDPKESVRASTTAALPAVTYNNGASGVGATLTANANGTLPAQDGVTLIVGNRFLVKDQAAALQNGIYTVTSVGSGGTPFVLTRATDQDGSPVHEVSGGNFTFVEAGTTLAGSGWTVLWDGDVNIGTDPINWSKFSSITFIGGDMISLTGNTISVDLATTSGLESTNPGNVAGQLRIKLEAANPSLRFSGSNEIGIKFDPAGALAAGAAGSAVQVDNTTIEISSNALRVKDAGISLAKLASNSVDENKIVSTAMDAAGAILGGSGTKLKVNVDASSIEISSNALRVKSTAYDQVTITGGSGSAAQVAQAPVVAWTDVAGQSFSANVTVAVRYGLVSNGETAGRVYAADISTGSFDLFNVIGFIQPTGSVSAGQNVSVISNGSLTLLSGDTNFSSGDTGKALFLQSSGVQASTTAPSTSGQAVLRVGFVKTTTSFRVQVGSAYVA